MTNKIEENFQIKVLLIDDQPIISEAIKQMLKDRPDICFSYCQEPANALKVAKEFQPTVILQDLVMPDIDGLTLVKYLRADPQTKVIPLIVLSSKEEAVLKAEAFSLGANDYLVKLPNEIELIARIVYHSKAYVRHLQRDEAYRKLEESEKKLKNELDEAAAYVKKLLPDEISNEKIDTKWHFIPSLLLGGDAFGYEWLDQDHLSIYLLDVCGHGVGAALLSISIINALRGQKLSNADFFTPASVLSSLNRAFKMEAHNNMFFTIWYGVIDTKRDLISYCSGGHPPALLFQGKSEQELSLKLLDTQGLAIGVSDDVEYTTNTATFLPYNRLYIFSDGTFEVTKEDHSMVSFDEFVSIVKESQSKALSLEKILDTMTHLQKKQPFEDDYSIIELVYRC